MSVNAKKRLQTYRLQPFLHINHAFYSRGRIDNETFMKDLKRLAMDFERPFPISYGPK